MKKAFILALTPLVFATSALAANVIDLTVSPTDFANYKAKPEKYVFTDAQLRLGNEPAMKVEEMETRGQGSISYRRKNFGLKLEEQIHIGRVHAKKIDLLSMSADTGYISSRLGLMTAELLNIGAPMPTEYVEVKINGKTNGLYSIVEKPKAVLSKSPYVVRRGYLSRFLTNDAEYSTQLSRHQVKEIEAVAASIYHDVATKKGESLFNSLKSKMDIDAYMRWMVMNSLYTNGDFPDEVFFYVDGDLYKQGRIYFRIMPWDFDDLFKEMHSVSINALSVAKMENKQSILYSYEDLLDRAFSPVNTYVYEQLKATTREVLTTQLTQESTDDLLKQIHDELAEYLTPAIIQMSSKDSGRRGIPYTKSEIANLFAKRKKQIDARRALLMERAK